MEDWAKLEYQSIIMRLYLAEIWRLDEDKERINKSQKAIQRIGLENRLARRGHPANLENWSWGECYAPLFAGSHILPSQESTRLNDLSSHPQMD